MMRFKTLVIHKGTERQEFYGHMKGYGWVTSSSPIHTMSEDITWEHIKRVFPDEDFSFYVELVTIELNILD